MVDKAPIGDLVQGVIKRLKKGRLSEEEMASVWVKAVGRKGARHSHPASLRRGVLFVNVDRSSWLYELTLRKKEILEKMEGKMKRKPAKDIRFRIGEIGK